MTFKFMFQAEQNTGSLKEELRAIVPQVEEMRKRRNDRLNQFKEVLEQIQKISKEIFGPGDYKPSNFVVDETDLSMRKLDELHGHLLVLQKEKVCPCLSFFLLFFKSLSPIDCNAISYNNFLYAFPAE